MRYDRGHSRSTYRRPKPSDLLRRVLGTLRIHPKVVQERLGHSTIAVTLDMYSHVIAGMQADAAATVADLMRSSVTNP